MTVSNLPIFPTTPFTPFLTIPPSTPVPAPVQFPVFQPPVPFAFPGTPQFLPQMGQFNPQQPPYIPLQTQLAPQQAFIPPQFGVQPPYTIDPRLQATSVIPQFVPNVPFPNVPNPVTLGGLPQEVAM